MRGRFHLLTINRGVVHWPAVCGPRELLGLGAAAQNLWTAAVLLAAVTVDTVARRNRPNA